MKKGTLILLILFCLSAFVGCKRTVDYSYPMELVYVNGTEHTINLVTSSSFTPLEISLGSGERYSKIWAEGFPYPLEITEAEVTFDDLYTVVHSITDQAGTYHNVCNKDDYVLTSMKKVKYGRVYTFTFTEEDYQYAVNASAAQ